MSLRTALIIDGNSEGGMRALRDLEGSIESAEAEAKKLSAAFAAADISVTRLANAQTQAKASSDALKASFAAGEIGLEEYNRGLLETKTALGLVETEHRKHIAELNRARAASADLNVANGAQKAGLQQLMMNLSDMTTMYGMGAKASQIFGSQIGQVVQSVQLLSGGTGKFAAFMSNPWVMGITMGTMVLGPLVAGLLDTEEAAGAAEFASYGLKDAQSILGGVIDLTTGKINTQSSALMTLAKAQAIAGKIQAEARQAEARSQISEMTGKEWEFGGGLMGLYVGRKDKPTKDAADLFLGGDIDASTAIDVLRGLQQDGKITKEVFLDAAAAFANFGVEAENIKVFEDLEKALGGDTHAMQQFLRATKDRKGGGDSHAATLLREAEATEALTKGLWDVAAAYLQNDAAALKAEITAQATSQAIGKQADKEEYVARQIKKVVAERAASAAEAVAGYRNQADAQQLLNNQVAQGLITSEEAAQILRDEDTLRSFIVAQTLAEGDAKEKLTEIIAKLRGEMQRANAETKRAQDLAGTEQQSRQLSLTSLQIEMEGRLGKARIDALKGLTGSALEEELARINHQREIETIRMQATAEAAELQKRGMNETASAVLAVAEANVELANKQFEFDRAEADIARVNAQLDTMLQLLGEIGGFAGVVGDIIKGIQTGDFSGLGPIGGLINIALMGEDDLAKQVDNLANKLETTFGLDGAFSKVLAQALQGAGIGMTAGSIFAGKTYSTEEQIGGAIGGAVGNAIGTAIAGPIGGAIGSAILGSLGSVLGGLVSGVARGGVTLNGSGVVSTYGGSSERLGAANDAASAITSQLAQIAAQLGGTLDASAGSVSIGMRKDSWRVDTTGQGITKVGSGALDFGDDADAAVKAAIMDLIRDGVITGISASAQNLLRAGSDLQAQLDKALKFEGAFTDLENATNPLAAAIKELHAKFAELNSIAKEAGATTEEYAKIQKLQQIQLQQLIEQASSSYRSTFWSDAENADYAKAQIAARMGELGYSGVDTVDEYKALVASVDTSTEEGLKLYGALMDMADMFAVLKDADEKAAQEAEAAASEAKALAAAKGQLQVELLRAQGREAEAVAKERALQLEQLDASLRADQQAVWAAQDLADAKTRLREAYQNEKGDLEDTIETMTRMGASLWDLRASLDASADGSVDFARAQARLREIGFKASVLGDQEAMGQLSGALNDYLPAALKNASSQIEYDRYMAEARRITAGAAGAADSAADVAQEQLDAMTAQVSQLIDLNENVLSVHDAILELQRLTAAGGTGGSASGGGTGASQAQQDREDRKQRHREVRDRLDRLDKHGILTADLQQKLVDFFKRMEEPGEGLRVVTVS